LVNLLKDAEGYKSMNIVRYDDVRRDLAIMVDLPDVKSIIEAAYLPPRGPYPGLPELVALLNGSDEG
jgi:hypothetical protein